MSRASINFLVDCVLFLLFLSLFWTSILIQSFLPPPSESHGATVAGLGYDQWARISFWLTIAFAIIVGLHLILHWTWVCGFVATRWARLRGRRVEMNESVRTVYGVIMLISVITLFLALWFAASLTTRLPSQREASPPTAALTRGV